MCLLEGEEVGMEGEGGNGGGGGGGSSLEPRGKDVVTPLGLWEAIARYAM